MRIDHLELSRYGCFTDRFLDLSGPGVHLVVGPNEAGKSTVRRAIGDLLYGIPERTTLDFVHGKPDLRLAARLSGNGSTLNMVRLKQRKEPLQTPEGEPLAEGTLSALLAGIGRAEFESTFAFDHAELRRGGQQLLDGEGDLGTALFETRSNRRLTDLLDSLDERMGKLFKRNAQLPTINAALSQIAEARRQVSSSLLRPADYDRVARAKDDAGKRREQLREEFRRFEEEHARLKRTLEAKPLLADLARLQQERADLEPAGSDSGSDAGAATGSPSTASINGATILRLGADLAILRERTRDTVADSLRAETNRENVRAMLTKLVVDDAVLAAEAEVERLHADRSAVQETAEQERLDRVRAEETRTKAQKLLGDASSDEENKALAAALNAVIKAVPADLLLRTTDRSKQVDRLRRSVRTLREKHALPETVENWPALPVPAREQVTAFKEQFTALDVRERELSHRHEEAGRTLAEDRRGLATVLAGDPPPSELELAAARSARETAWLALRDLMTAGEHGRESDYEDYAAAVRHADALADRMRREAQRQTERLRLEVAVNADEQVVAGFTRQLDELEQTRRDTQARWAAAWLPTALHEPDPAAATDLLNGIESLAGRAADLADAQAELDSCLAEIESAEVRLRQSLSVSASASAPDLTGAGLAELLELAAQRRTGLDAAGQQREKADALLAEAAELEVGADAKAERVHRFTRAVASAARACGGGSSDPDADAYAVVADLHTRLLDARRSSASVETLSTQAAELDRELSIAAEARQTASLELNRLVEAAGADDEAHLDALVERATAAADLDQKISDLTSPLTRTGVPLPTLIAEAADWPDPDKLASAVTDLAETLRERRIDLDTASEELGSRLSELTAMDGSAVAAEAAEHLAGQQAALIEHSEEYLRLYLGRELLRRCIEDYQQANQDPVLARAQALFTTLTGGRFTELSTDLDQHGRDILRVRRANGTLVNIGPELSEGTLDQLYLALRLAALQRYADAERAMPLVFDDIFITSDDARTAAGLTALDAISDQFQVVVFTHHDHLAVMAREVLPAGRIHVTELPSSLV